MTTSPTNKKTNSKTKKDVILQGYQSHPTRGNPRAVHHKLQWKEGVGDMIKSYSATH